MPASVTGWQQQWAVLQPRYAAYVQQALQATLAALWQQTPAEWVEGIPVPETLAQWQGWAEEKRQQQQLTAEVRHQWEQLLSDTLAQPVAQALHVIEAERNNVSCGQCGVCCRLTSSEHSVDVLEAMANEGDGFAKEFLSVMLPYASTEVARKRFPEHVDVVLAKQPEHDTSESAVHFYHCPYVGEDNRCTLWGSAKRPGMCATYPETPLVWIQPGCHWSGWQHQRLEDTLKAHATLAVLDTCLQQVRSIM